MIRGQANFSDITFISGFRATEDTACSFGARTISGLGHRRSRVCSLFRSFRNKTFLGSDCCDEEKGERGERNPPWAQGK